MTCYIRKLKLTYLRESYLLLFIIFSLNKIEISDWLSLQPLNIPKQVDASSCGIHAILNILFLLQLGGTYHQFDIVNSTI